MAVVSLGVNFLSRVVGLNLLLLLHHWPLALHRPKQGRAAVGVL
jgi:hypothetical protein